MAYPGRDCNGEQSRTQDFRKEGARPEGGSQPLFKGPFTPPKWPSVPWKGSITPPKGPITPVKDPSRGLRSPTKLPNSSKHRQRGPRVVFIPPPGIVQAPSSKGPSCPMERARALVPPLSAPLVTSRMVFVASKSAQCAMPNAQCPLNKMLNAPILPRANGQIFWLTWPVTSPVTPRPTNFIFSRKIVQGYQAPF